MGDDGVPKTLVDDDTSTNSYVDDKDITTIETAVDGILDNVQKNLGFVYTTKDPAPKPSVELDYHFYAGIEVYLTTNWTLFPGLTLTNIALKAAVNKYKNSPGRRAHLTGSAT